MKTISFSRILPLLVFFVAESFAQVPAAVPASSAAETQSIYGPAPVPWSDVWVVQNPKLPPGVDYHVNHYAEWKSDALKAYDAATAAVTATAKQVPAGTLWAVIMDIDDTILDHSRFQKMLSETEQTFSSALWRGWVESKNAALVPGAKEFMETVNKLGGKIVLISNIKDYEELAVRERLAGYEIHEGPHYAFILARALASQDDKGERQKVVAALTRLTDAKDEPDVSVIVVGSVGDQLTDKMDGVAFHPVPQGSSEYGMYGKPAIGQVPPPPK